jgi:hypothetical protein
MEFFNICLGVAERFQISPVRQVVENSPSLHPKSSRSSKMNGRIA